MKKQQLKASLFAGLAVLALVSCGQGGGESGASASSGGYSGKIKTIYIDGGGDIGDYNTTASMTKSESNPFPYNTLKTLCEEWETSHPGYEVKINKTSAHGDRSILEGQLKMHTACHIIYQNGNVINSDLGKDYYVDLTDYLNSPNPYLENNAAWKTVYNESELASTQASDGSYYYVNLEKIPVCFMYNKTLLKKAGIDVDNMKVDTLNDLCNVMASFQSWQNKQSATEGYGTYSTLYTWYQLALETNMFSDLVESCDVLRQNGMVDTEELCRAYKKGIFTPEAVEGNRYYELLRLIQKLDTYKESASYACAQSWSAGKLAFMEATGSHLRTYSAADLDFEWGTFCFPDISLEDYSGKSLKGVVRGIATLATSWWVTNTAVDDDTVAQCVDLLQFLTAPAQNNRLVGDLGGGIPLNPDSSTQMADYLKPLVNQYNADLAEGGRQVWSAFSPSAVLNINFQNSFIRTMQEMDAGTKTLDEAASTLVKQMKAMIASTIIENGYDETAW